MFQEKVRLESDFENRVTCQLEHAEIIMLDGFVVPHAHFRVFHGNAFTESVSKANVDQAFLRFDEHAVRRVATDLHLREFAQLEAQVKALQQQLQQLLPAASPTSPLIEIAQSAALVECFSFYGRLMTAESFTSPDFLVAVFSKLTEHFVAMENISVRKAIVDVFSNSRAHVSRVPDGSKICSHVDNLISKSSPPRAILWGLRLLETMPSLVRENSDLHARLLELVASPNAEEQQAAIQVVSRILPYSAALRQVVFSMVVSSSSSMLIELLPDCVDEYDTTAMEEAWNFCVNLFHRQIGDEETRRCLVAASKLASKRPHSMVPRQLELLEYVITNDPRVTVVENAWTIIGSSASMINQPAMKEQFERCLVSQLTTKTNRRVNAAALKALERFAHFHGHIVPTVMSVVDETLSLTPAFNIYMLKILMNCARYELSRGDDQAASLVKLMQYLSPTKFKRRQKLWVLALESIEVLASEYSASIGTYIAQCIVALIQVSRRKQLTDMEAALWKSLSKCGNHGARIVSEHFQLLTPESFAKFDSKTKQAIAVSLVRSTIATQAADQDSVLSLCDRLIGESDTGKYELARLAMSEGGADVAVRLLAPIADRIDHECFGSWIRALVSICDVEIQLRGTQQATMEAHHRLLYALNLLRGVVSSKYGFQFQVQFVSARLQWLNLVLQAQQFADEIAHTNLPGGDRERRLRDGFLACANEYSMVRSKMLGSSSRDQDVLVYHSDMCHLLANATSAFLLHEPDALGSSTHGFSTQSTVVEWIHVIELLTGDARQKTAKLASIASSQRPHLGATVFSQLLRACLSLPYLKPYLFFRSKLPSTHRVRSNAQFLTHAEATSTSSKPKTRSQIGVARGTDFSCVIQGAVALYVESDLQDRIESIEITVAVSREKPDDASVSPAKQVVSRSTVPFKPESGLPLLATDQWVYAELEVPVYISTDVLTTKGTYIVEASVALIDTSEERWLVAPTGARRHVIVY